MCRYNDYNQCESLRDRQAVSDAVYENILCRWYPDSYTTVCLQTTVGHDVGSSRQSVDVLLVRSLSKINQSYYQSQGFNSTILLDTELYRTMHRVITEQLLNRSTTCLESGQDTSRDS